MTVDIDLLHQHFPVRFNVVNLIKLHRLFDNFFNIYAVEINCNDCMYNFELEILVLYYFENNFQ